MVGNNRGHCNVRQFGRPWPGSSVQPRPLSGGGERLCVSCSHKPHRHVNVWARAPGLCSRRITAANTHMGHSERQHMCAAALHEPSAM